MKRLHHDYGFGNPADFSAEFPDYFPQSSSNGFINQSSENGLWPNSSGSIIGRIGSPATAFSATEVHMGLTQCDFQQHNSILSKNSDPRIPSYGNGLFQEYSQTQPSNSHYIRPNGSSKNPHNFSESEQLQYLKNKLLSEFDDSVQDLPISLIKKLESQNSYPIQFGNVNQFGTTQSNKYVPTEQVSSSKTRIRWTQDLHDRFVTCVNELGGPDKATPRAILNLMDSEGLTILHVKSHLQKYRNTTFRPEFVEGQSEKKTSSSRNVEKIDIKTSVQLKEALHLQLNAQRHLHEQLEIQKELQLRIEEQWKQLQMMVEQQQKTTKSFMQSRTNSDNECPNNLSATLEDPEVFILDGSDDDMVFPSKIS